MGNEYPRTVGIGHVNRRKYAPACRRIDFRETFIEDHDRHLAEQRAGKSNALSQAA
jgi:hypothetical protein